MSSDAPDDWGEVLADVEPATFAEVSGALERDDDRAVSDGAAAVETALANGVLVEQDSGGAFPVLASADGDGAANTGGGGKETCPERFQPGGPRPLERYAPHGYAYPVDGEATRETRAHDAAAHLTASSWGPPFGGSVGGDEWSDSAYRWACAAVESVVVDALLANDTSGEGRVDGGCEHGESGRAGGVTDAAGDDADGGGHDATDERGERESVDDGEPAAEAAARAAFADAIRWYHDRLDDPIHDHDADGEHPDRPDTAREYFEHVRGFDADTVDEKLLGWAPPNARDELLAHLHRRGHDRDAMLATGLFTDDLRPLWNGRYVFPYFGRDGEPVYAIARCTGGDGGGDVGYGGHPSDFIKGKYGKLAHKKRGVLDEPIYGLATLERDGPVLITEGVADAIRAHEAGYVCLSPVTTEFKKAHREPLLDILDDVERRVFLVQDAERPPVEYTDDVDGWDALGIQQHGPGVAGGLRTAAFLREHGVDAYLAELPRLGLDKVDLDDYLGEWSDTLAPVLASAQPPSHHPAYVDDMGARDSSGAGDAPSSDGDGDWSGESSTGGGYDGGELDETAVKDALSHVDNSLRYDDWIRLGYAVHDWDAGARGRRVFENWSRKSPKWEEPTSPDAIGWIWENATQGGDTTVSTLVHRAQQGGWEPPKPGPEPVLPLGRLQALDDDDARRHARRHGVEWPSTDDVRERLSETIHDAFAEERRVVVDAPTSAGKSYEIAATPWRDVDSSVTGDAPVIQFHETTDARDDAAATTRRELGDDAVRRLLAGVEACPVLGGEHDPDPERDDDEREKRVITVDGSPVSEWAEEMLHERGLPFSVVHAYAREHNDQGLPELPCSPGEQICHSQAQYAGVPRNDDGEPTADVVHATHPFAHVPSLRQSSNLVFDEQPDFARDIEHDRGQRAITAFLGLSEDGPDSWEELVALALECRGSPFDESGGPNAPGGARVADLRDRYLAATEALEHEPPRRWYFADGDAHTLAKPLAAAVFQALTPADPFGANGRATERTTHHPPRFDDDAGDGDGWNREYVSVVVDDDHRIRRVRAAPDLSGARAVVGLDAHPNGRVWRRNVGPDMTTESVLDVTERRRWRVFERQLTIAQVGDAVRPKGRNGKYYDRDGDAALVESIRDEYGDLRSGVVPKCVREEYGEILEEHGADVDRDDVTGAPQRVLTFGEEKSRNDLAGESVGMVSHSLDPGDEYILDWLAECGLDATPSTVECESCDGDGCESCDGDGEHREHGRGFDGDDAGAAEAFLATVREQHLIQSAGRYARSPDDPDDGATVFVRSAALPDEYTDVRLPGVAWLGSDIQREIVGGLRRRPTATVAELADAVDVSKQHVRGTLERLVDAGAVERRERAGEHGAHVYRALAGAATTAAVVELEPDDDETTNGDVWDSSTWALAVRAPNSPDAPVPEASPGATGGDATPTPGEQLGLEAFDRGPPGD